MGEDADRPRILIVDDSADDAEMYRLFLKSRGYVVAVASDGEDAVSRALNGTFDVVVLDIGLPKLDGFQVLTLLRSYISTSRLPVITLSARTGEAVRAAALPAGADLALEKPLAPEDLEAAIEVFVPRGQEDSDQEGRRVDAAAGAAGASVRPPR
jgi:two-component system KDP operon response regulator KdpE